MKTLIDTTTLVKNDSETASPEVEQSIGLQSVADPISLDTNLVTQYSTDMFGGIYTENGEYQNLVTVEQNTFLASELESTLVEAEKFLTENDPESFVSKKLRLDNLGEVDQEELSDVMNSLFNDREEVVRGVKKVAAMLQEQVQGIRSYVEIPEAGILSILEERRDEIRQVYQDIAGPGGVMNALWDVLPDSDKTRAALLEMRSFSESLTQNAMQLSELTSLAVQSTEHSFDTAVTPSNTPARSTVAPEQMQEVLGSEIVESYKEVEAKVAAYTETYAKALYDIEAVNSMSFFQRVYQTFASFGTQTLSPGARLRQAEMNVHNVEPLLRAAQTALLSNDFSQTVAERLGGSKFTQGDSVPSLVRDNALSVDENGNALATSTFDAVKEAANTSALTKKKVDEDSIMLQKGADGASLQFHSYTEGRSQFFLLNKAGDILHHGKIAHSEAQKLIKLFTEKGEGVKDDLELVPKTAHYEIAPPKELENETPEKVNYLVTSPEGSEAVASTDEELVYSHDSETALEEYLQAEEERLAQEKAFAEAQEAAKKDLENAQKIAEEREAILADMPGAD